MDPGLSPPPYPAAFSDDNFETASALSWLSSDPRASSTVSLAPSESRLDSQRRLLIVYIHGYQGTDTSFKEFPFHVHRYLRACLDSHVIHTKIYPRYKTYKSLEIARDNFGAWLEPHESDDTDVVLVGHSMGGLLAAEVALAPSRNPYGHRFKHRILGTISLDSPLLGLHPGIITSGIASLFRSKSPPPPAAATPDAGPATPSPYHDHDHDPSAAPTSPTSPGAASVALYRPGSDPNFNPHYFNDTGFQQRPFGERLVNFVYKHSSEGILGAVGQHFQSHLEFNGCLLDYPGLNARYGRLRAMEDVDELQGLGDGAGGIGPDMKQLLSPDVRIRFANYYTLCYGRRKDEKEQQQQQQQQQGPPRPAAWSDSQLSNPVLSPPPSCGRSLSTPRISIEDYGGTTAYPPDIGSLDLDPNSNEDKDGDGESPHGKDEQQQPPSIETGAVHRGFGDKNGDSRDVGVESPSPAPVAAPPPITFGEILSPQNPTPSAGLPPIPDPPPPYEPVDLNQFSDPEERRQAERENKHAYKAYQRAAKSRDRTIREREKMLARQEKDRQKEVDRRAKLVKKQLRDVAAQRKLEESLREAWDAEEEDGQAPDGSPGSGRRGPEKAPKERKFCIMPKKVDGVRDPAWVPVQMGHVDEVEAHCGLFVPGPHYERLIGDFGSRIIGWVQEDLTKKAILGLAFE